MGVHTSPDEEVCRRQCRAVLRTAQASPWTPKRKVGNKSGDGVVMSRVWFKGDGIITDEGDPQARFVKERESRAQSQRVHLSNGHKDFPGHLLEAFQFVISKHWIYCCS